MEKTDINKDFSLRKLHFSTNIEKEISIKDPHFYDFFVNSCMKIFGRRGNGYRHTQDLDWSADDLPHMSTHVTINKKSTLISANIEVLNEATFFLAVGLFLPFLYYPFSYLIFKLIQSYMGSEMRSLWYFRIPGLGLSIVLIYYLVRKWRIHTMKKAFMDLILAIKNFPNNNNYNTGSDAYQNALLESLPEGKKRPGLFNIYYRIHTKRRLNPQMDSSEKDDITRSMQYALKRYWSPYTAGFMIASGSERDREIFFTPRKTGTEIEFRACLNDFVSFFTLFSSIALVVISILLIGYLHVHRFGATGETGNFIQNVILASIILSFLVGSGVNFIKRAIRLYKFKLGAPHLAERLEAFMNDTPVSDLFRAREKKLKVQHSADMISKTDQEKVRSWLKSINKDPFIYIEKKEDTFIFMDIGVGDDDIRYLGKLKHLRILMLQNTNITDRGLTYLKDLTNLEELNLSKNRISGSGLVSLHAMKNLEILDLSETNVTDEGMKNLFALVSLKKLDLYDTNVTTRGLISLKKLANLNMIRIDHEKINVTEILRAGGAHLFSREESLDMREQGATDDDLKYLKGFKRTGDLYLSKNRITGSGLNHLKDMTFLRSLYLSYNPISDKALIHLKDIKRLKHLSLAFSKVTKEGLNDLKISLPGCIIKSNIKIN
ncbi:MAG: hypothetical protein KKH98_05650 [Spirochaetes bacterium]|nr:hypothetical protein [Spirochaetota bacterium]